MLNNYRFPHYYPQPQLLKDEYKYALDRFEMQLPLPGYSIKMPYQEKPTRFLTVNRRKREIDYLKSHIQHKCDMEQLHYQAKIEQMRRENQLNRQKLEQLLRQQPPNLFSIPQPYINQARTVSSSLEKISRQRLPHHSQQLLIDSVDKIKLQSRQNKNQSLQKQNLSDGSSEDSQEKVEQKKRRQEDLDYIYKKNGKINTDKHFGTEPILKNEEQKQKQKQKQKRDQYEWIQKVRKAKAAKFIAESDSDDSSKPSESSRSKKKPEQEQRVRKQEQIKSNRNAGIQFQRYNNSRQPVAQRQKTPSKRSERTPSNSEDISNMSQFSRYANKKQIANKEKKGRRMQNIFEGDEGEEEQGLQISKRRQETKNWKI